MANPVAGLVVNLALNAVEYFRGLNKAEYEAKKFSQSFDSSTSLVKKGLGGLGIGLVVREIFDLSKSIVSAAADLSDFSDQTGSSIASLSKLADQAQIAGTPFAELQTAVLRLSVNMGGAGKRSEDVAKILKTLGVSARDPAQAVQEIAVSLAKYEDGATKAAYAQILFNQSGAKFLSTLADIAKLQDVVGTTTAEQVKQAKELEQAYNRLGVESTAFKNAILSDVVPALLTSINLFNEARKAGFGFLEALELGARGKADLPGEIAAISDALRKASVAATQGKAAFNGLNFDALFGDAMSPEKTAEWTRRLRVLQKVNDEFQRSAEDRKFNPFAQVLPEPPKRGGGGRTARTPADRISDAERYLKSLELQLQKTQELSAEETILDDIQEGRFKTESAAQTARALFLGRQIDAAKALEKAEKERTKLAADQARQLEHNEQIKQRGIDDLKAETAALEQGNEQLRLEIETIGLDATSMAQLTARRLEDAAATKERNAAIFHGIDGMEEEAAQMEKQAQRLRVRAGLLSQKGVAEQYAADMQKAKEINDAFANSFTEAAKSVIYGTKSIGDAVKNMGKRITDVLLDMALNNIAKSLFGAPTSSGGGGIFGGIGAAIMGSIFGGGSGGGGYGMNVRAYGGPVAAGTPYMVGERGPEMFIPKTAGTVVANNQLGQRGNYVFNINVPAGATRSTIDQTRVKFGLELQNALDRGS